MTYTDTDFRSDFPKVSNMLSRILGRARKGLSHISKDKTALWSEVQRLQESYIANTSDQDHDPYAAIREALEIRVADLEMELEICENRSAGLERLSVAGRMAGDSWAGMLPTPERAKELRTMIASTWPVLSKALDRLAIIAGSVKT